MISSYNLTGHIALVTGASRGIGYACALGLARLGAHVVALARTVGGLEELDNAIQASTGRSATLVPLDITDFDALDRLGASLYERFGKLDVLVANAALLTGLSPLAHVKPADFNKMMATNITANWRLLRALDPLLRQAPQGRVICLSDAAAYANQPYWGAYAATKAALDVLAKTYAAETAHTHLRVACFDPGPMRTALRARAFPGDDESPKPDPDLAKKMLDCFSGA